MYISSPNVSEETNPNADCSTSIFGAKDIVESCHNRNEETKRNIHFRVR